MNLVRRLRTCKNSRFEKSDWKRKEKCCGKWQRFFFARQV